MCNKQFSEIRFSVFTNVILPEKQLSCLIVILKWLNFLHFNFIENSITRDSSISITSRQTQNGLIRSKARCQTGLNSNHERNCSSFLKQQKHT